MSDPFVAEIRAFGFSFAPYNWAFCAGQTLPIQQNTALFSLLGINFGGNGTTNFQLPNLGGQVPLHAGTGPGLTPRSVGDQVGSSTVTLALPQLPVHNHSLNAQTLDGDGAPAGNMLAKGGHTDKRTQVPYPTYVATAPSQSLAQACVSQAGGNQPHQNRQPNLTLNFCIALSGIFPSRP